jgi:hypothetical protein
MRAFKVLILFLLVHPFGFSADFVQDNYAGFWNLSFETDGNQVKKNEIVVYGTLNNTGPNRYNGAKIYSVRGYLWYREILGMVVFFDIEIMKYKIHFITLNIESPIGPEIMQGDLDGEEFEIAENSTHDLIHLTSRHGMIHKATLTRGPSFQ